MHGAIETPEGHSSAAPTSRFNTTHWSVISRAGRENSPESREALDKLCRTYWRPLQAFARRLGHSEPDAQDLTQGFFAHFFEKGSVRVADRARGRFRTFLLTSFQHFIQGEWIKARAVKRGGARALLSLEDLSPAEQEALGQPTNDPAATAVFDRQWAAEVFSRAMSKLAEEFAVAGKAGDFQRLKFFLSQPAGRKEAYAEVAKHLGAQPETVAVTVHRMRRRYRELLRAEIEATVSRVEDVEDELRYLMEIIKSG
ncbi:MAG: sigma-70 family RNA polymerase sigma factor [Verrucomicrobiales bacterium]|nr:sigma-70 family RNA polymerase sigma factor [Verrucomicrobiales bacterium]